VTLGYRQSGEARRVWRLRKCDNKGPKSVLALLFYAFPTTADGYHFSVPQCLSMVTPWQGVQFSSDYIGIQFASLSMGAFYASQRRPLED
jgi:hypothetical protein